MRVGGWNGNGVSREALAMAQPKLRAAAAIVRNRARTLISVPGTAPGGRGRARVYGAIRSRPGEPPRKQTGRLRMSVALEVEGLVARVGTNVKYGLYLELGTRRMAPRPWLRRSLDESKPDINRLF